MSSHHNDRSPNRLYKTNDYSIVSKYSAAKLGYFDDPVLLSFAEKRLAINKKTRRTPLVNIGYANRVLVVDHKVTSLIESHEVDCIIVLGCGFDTLATRHMSKGCAWIEIDLPQVIKAKSSFLALEWEAPMIQVGLVPDVITFKGKPTFLVSCDIRFHSELSSKLSKVVSLLPSTKHVAILNEVCLNYLETDEVHQVISTIEGCIKDRVSIITYLGFEQVRPAKDDPFTKVMTDHFESISHPLKHFRTRASLENLFIDRLEFEDLDIESLHKLYRVQEQLKSGDLNFRFDREPFDEFEELDMYMAHYAMVKAQKRFNRQDCHSKDGQFPYSHSLKVDAQVEMSTNCIREEADEHIRRYAHSVCVLKDTTKEQAVLISGGFGVVREGEQHRRLQQCLIMSRASDEAAAWQAKPVSFGYPQSKLIVDDSPFSMHGETCCVDSEEKIVFFCGGRGSPSPNSRAKPTFVAKITPDYKLEHAYSFKERTLLHSRLPTTRLDSWTGCQSKCWRHRIVKRGNEIVQLGGLPSRNLHWGAEMPIVTYQLDADRLGASAASLRWVEPRHSFGSDMRDDQTLLVYGGLRVEQAPESITNDGFKTFVSCDRDIRPARETLLYDFRLNCPIQRTEDQSSGSYGMQVHFINDNQFARVGGISTATGLAEQSIELFDLRRLDLGPVVKTPIESKQNDLLLTNTASVKFQSTQQIVTFGGGATCFTFGTHFNRSQVIYNYARLPSGDE